LWRPHFIVLTWISQQEGEVWVTTENGETVIVSVEINILAQADAHIGTHVEEASQLRLAVITLNTIVKNRK
jgi:hypothetical protein